MNKVTLFLVITAIALALLLINLLVGDSRQDRTPLNKERGPLLTDFKSSAVNKITLKKGGTVVELDKVGAEWIMPLQKKRTAKSDRIQRLLSDVETAYSIGPRPSKNAEAFELSAATRTEVTFEAPDKKTTLFIGKNLPQNGSFVQRDASGPILEIDKYLPSSAGVREEKSATILDPAFFYDLKIFADSADDAIDVVIKKGHEVFRVQKVLPGKGPLMPNQKLEKDDKPVWWITEPEGAMADEAKVRSICSTVLNLTGKGYADEIADKDRGFDKSPAKVLIRLKDGAERSMSFGKIDGDDVLVSAVGKADAFKVNKYVYDTCTKLDEIKKKEEKKEGEEKKDEKPEAPKPPVAPPPPPTKPATTVPIIPAPK